MSKDPSKPESHFSRRHFLGTAAAAGAVGAGVSGGLLTTSPLPVAQAALEENSAHVAPGDLDEYYGLWSGGQSGEMRVLGVPSMREISRIAVFNHDSATGYGYTNESKRILGESAKFFNGDTHHPHASYTDGRYDGRYAYLNDKANSRVARIRLDIFKTDKVVTIPNITSVHGLRLQKYPKTGYVFANGEMIIPQPNDGRDLDDPANYWTLFTALDGETMAIAWQVMVEGNLDNVDTDYQGKYAFSTAYNSERGVLLADMMRNERDHVAVFNIPRIEAAVKAGRFTTIGDSTVPVLDGRKSNANNDFVKYVPVPKSPHGINVSPDGKYAIANGKLSPTVTVIEIAKLDALFDNADADLRSVVVAEPELGLGPLHTTYDGRGYAYTTLFIDSQVVKWSIAEAIRAYQGEAVNYIRQKLDVHYQPGHLKASMAESRDADGKWLVVLCKFSKDRFLPAGILRPENDQLIDISGAEMKLVHDGPTFSEPHDCVMIHRSLIHSKRVWDRDDPYFADTVAMAKADGVTLEYENRVVRDGNKVRVYMTAVAPQYGLTEFRVKQGDEVTIVVTNMDTIEDLSHGFVMTNHGVMMEVSPQQTASFTFTADKPGVHWYYCPWFCHALHMEMCGRMLVEPSNT